MDIRKATNELEASEIMTSRAFNAPMIDDLNARIFALRFVKTHAEYLDGSAPLKNQILSAFDEADLMYDRFESLSDAVESEDLTWLEAIRYANEQLAG